MVINFYANLSMKVDGPRQVALGTRGIVGSVDGTTPDTLTNSTHSLCLTKIHLIPMTTSG